MTLHTCHRQADHSSYVAAVSRGIEAQDISLRDVRIGVSPDGRREASMRLEPGDSTSLGQPLLEASLRWDEEYGWSFLARYDSVPLLPGSPVYKGLGVLPDPDDVAAWVVALLANPAIIPSREDGPYRLCSSADPAFDAQLARYSSGQLHHLFARSLRSPDYPRVVLGHLLSVTPHEHAGENYFEHSWDQNSRAGGRYGW